MKAAELLVEQLLERLAERPAEQLAKADQVKKLQASTKEIEDFRMNNNKTSMEVNHSHLWTT